MATSELLLDLTDRLDPASNAPGTTTTTSGTAAVTNGQQVRIFSLDFDQSTDETTTWIIPVPANYLSGGTVNIWWYSTALTSGNVVWKASIYVATASSSDIDTSSVFNTVDLSAATAVPATAGQFKLTSLALTSPGLAAARWAVLMVGRDANNGSDTAAGDCSIIGLSFSYTS